jgi:glycogen(starch) synthase
VPPARAGGAAPAINDAVDVTEADLIWGRQEAPASDAARAAWPRTVAFEVSWEVCNQVGGIYQVLRSKAPTMVHRWRHRYFAVGPYVPDRAPLEFEPLRSSGWIGRALRRVEEAGGAAHHGRWIVTGRPRVILLDHEWLRPQLEKLRERLKAEHGIETWSRDPLVDQVVTFAEAVRIFLEAATEEWCAEGGRGRRRGDRRVLAHFHEWLGGLAIPMLGASAQRIATVFTTHATQLGRVIASNDEDFYEHLPAIDPDAEADRYELRAQHQIERICARSCDFFTTVSPITAEECASLLGREPDLVTPNGLNIDRFDRGADFQTIHGQYKEDIHRFVMGHFFPSYAFDLDRTLYFFTSGRFEPSNKGFDLCLETVARLNLELSEAKLDVTVVFFVVTDRPTRSLDPLALRSRGVLDELHDVSHSISSDVAEQLFRRAAAGGRLRLDDLVDEYWALRFRRTQHALKSDRLPPLTTHLIDHDAYDPILQHLRTLKLRNAEQDRVKVVYHPEFISSVNPLWGIEYEQFVRGCHLGVFPSRYEPWGYTPLECVAVGVPAITSDLAGFGRYVAETWPDHDRWGVNLLHRRGRGFHETAADLAQKLLAFCRLDRRGRIALRNELQPRAQEFDWSRLGEAYHEVHDRALRSRG